MYRADELTWCMRTWMVRMNYTTNKWFSSNNKNTKVPFPVTSMVMGPATTIQRGKNRKQNTIILFDDLPLAFRRIKQNNRSHWSESCSFVWPHIKAPSNSNHNTAAINGREAKRGKTSAEKKKQPNILCEHVWRKVSPFHHNNECASA